jgi:hypothetical protein
VTGNHCEALAISYKTATTESPAKPSRAQGSGTRCAPRSLTSFAPCGACVVREPLSALALRFRQGRGPCHGTAPLPFPGSRGLRFAPPRAPGQRVVAWPGGSGIRKRARASAVETARASERAGTRRRPRERSERGLVRACSDGASAGRCGATSTPLEPPRASLGGPSNRGGTERGRPPRPGPEEASTAARAKRARGAQRLPAGRAGGGFRQGSVVVVSQGKPTGSFHNPSP